MRCATLATAILASLALSAPARADLIGTSVNGTLNYTGFGTTNYFDPANGLVSAGYGNSSPHGPNGVVIATPLIEYGIVSPNDTLTDDFTGGGLTLNLKTPASIGANSFVETFTDSAFSGLTLTKTADNFGGGGVSASLSGTTLTISVPVALTMDNGSYTATFTIGTPPGVPEPGPLALAGLGTLAAGLIAYRRRSSGRALQA